MVIEVRTCKSSLVCTTNNLYQTLSKLKDWKAK